MTDVKTDDVKTNDVQTDDVKTDDLNAEDLKKDDVKSEDVKVPEVKAEECAICLEELKKGATLITTECGHKFHFSCIQKTIVSSTPYCPVCRGDIAELRSAFHKSPAPQSQSSLSSLSSQSSQSSQSSPVNTADDNKSVDSADEALDSSNAETDDNNAVVGKNVDADGNELEPSDGSDPLQRQNLLLCTFGHHVKPCVFPPNHAINHISIANAQRALENPETTPITASVALELDAIDDKPHDLIGALTIKAGEAAGADRQPIDFVCIVDKSGSMSGTKIRLLKHVLRFCVTQLKDADRMSVIQFNGTPSVLTGLTRGTESGKSQLLSAINTIKASGGTAIYRAMAAGFHQMGSSSQRNPIRSILLLTDGQDKVTLRKLPKLIPCMPDCSLHTFGFGADHDAKLLNAIAEKTKGTFTFIASEPDIGPAFATTLGGLMSTVANFIEVVLECPKGFTFTKVYTSYDYKLNNSLSVDIPDVIAGESRDIVFELKAQSAPDCDCEVDTVTGVVTYTQPGATKQHSTIVTPCRLARDGNGKVNMAVNQQFNRVFTSESLSKAAKLVDEKDLSQAREMLDSGIKFLKQSASVDTLSTKGLISDLVDSKRKLRNTASVQTGYAQLQAYSNQHLYQRQTYQPLQSACQYGYNAIQLDAVTAYSMLPEPDVPSSSSSTRHIGYGNLPPLRRLPARLDRLDESKTDCDDDSGGKDPS